jgi:hypothetical protein
MMKVLNVANRREILGAGIAAGFLGTTNLSAQVVDASRTALEVSITLDGVTYRYPNGPKIPSYSVGFHDDGRIVFHYGRIWSPPQASLRPHRVKIENGATVLFDSDIPSHGWFQQWTFRPIPLAIKKTPAQIVAANRSFLFGDTGCKVGEVGNATFKGPMDNGGVTKGMPQTGERPDIGWTTDVVGSWMLGRSAGPMLAWAQAADSIPINFVDEKTGKPISLVQYPSANTYEVPGAQGQPWFAKGPNEKPDNTGYYGYSGGWEPDRAHWPSLTFTAFYATGMDLGLLLNLQHAANFITISDAANTSAAKGAVINPEQTRQIAWGLRSMFEAHVATQDAEAAGALSADLHPSSYFKKLLDQNLAFYGRYMADPARQDLRLVGDPTKLSPWGYDYLLTSLSLGVLTGHSDWTPLYLWILGNAIARTSGKTGYPPGYGTAYGIEPLAPGATWATAFAITSKMEIAGGNLKQADVDRLKVDPLNGGVAMAGHEYLFTTRAVLVMAAHLDKKGLAPVRQMYPELDACLQIVHRMVRAYGAMNPRVSVV